MLPSFLYPSYKQYKSDSDAVATWLATTARRCGYPEDLLTAEKSSDQKAPKLKGRARKLARDAAVKKPEGHQDPAQQSPKYLISLDMFTSLSEWIVKSKNPVIVVPASLATVLSRAIATRKRHSRWWNNRATEIKDESIRKSVQSHNYFIGVLEGVLETLRPRMTPEMQRDPLAATDDMKTPNPNLEKANMVNSFSDLKVDEPFEGIPQAPNATSQPSKPQEAKPEYVVKQDPDIDDVYFAVQCLFNDLDNLRRYIQGVWTGYKAGVFELVPASIATNTAIDFARLLQEDFSEMFPRHTDFEKHINVLFVSLCYAADQDPSFKELPDDEMNFAMYKAAEEIMFPAFMLLSSFKDVLEPDVLPMHKPGHFGIYDATSDRKALTDREKFREDKALLLELLPDFCVLAHRYDHPPAEDEMTRGMREMVQTQQVPIWLTFAAQITLDIHHILREQVSRGYDDLVRSARYVQNSIERVLEFHKDLRVSNWPRSNDQGLRQILDLITQWVRTDIVVETRQMLTRGSAIQLPLTTPFLFLKHHPIYCGLLSFSIKALCQEAGVTFANAWGSILYSAHLYNALRQEKLLSNTWQDMNLALSMHRTQQMFVGEYPKSFEEYFRRFSLAMGYSASNFAKNRRPGAATASKAGPRGLDELSPVSRMFKARFCHNESRINLSPDDVDLILKLQGDQNEGDLVYEDSKWSAPRIEIKADEVSDETNQELRSRYRKMKRSAASGIRPVQLISALFDAIQSETLELTFDHFRLHTFCWRFLRALQKALDDDLRKFYGAGYLEKEYQLPFVVGYIFMTAAQSSKLAGVLAPKKDKGLVTSQLFVKAAEVLREMLDSGAGEIEVSMLRKWFGMDVEVEDILTPVKMCKDEMK